MQKKVLLVSLVVGILYSVSFFLINTSTVYSAKLIKFGGLEVTKTKAQPIQDKEDEGYVCMVPGKTFEGRLKGSPKGTPTSWLIPEGNEAPSKGELTVKKNIILSYFYKTPITCERIEPPDVAVVMLDTVFKWNVPGK